MLGRETRASRLQLCEGQVWGFLREQGAECGVPSGNSEQLSIKGIL